MGACIFDASVSLMLTRVPRGLKMKLSMGDDRNYK